jgi:transcriptional regulator with XRE-family HTH domain
MTDLAELGQAVRQRRTELGQSREQLASAAGVSRARIEALENARAVEMGFQNLMQILNALGLDLRLTELNRQRPTLEDLQKENTRK